MIKGFYLRHGKGVDTDGGSDRDFNDLVVGLDFTGASGHRWLV